MAAKPTVHAVSFGDPPDPTKITTYPGVARRASARIRKSALVPDGKHSSCKGYLPHEALVIYRPLCSRVTT